MTNLRNSLFLIAILLSTPAFCWQNTPEAALEEMATADKLEVMVKHLPVKVQEAIEKLDEKGKKEIANKLLAKSHMEHDGIRFNKSDDGTFWEVKNKKGELEGTVRVKDSFISGTEALLSVEFKRGPEPSDAKEPSPERRPRMFKEPEFIPESILILVSMRLEEGEWRVIGFGPWEHKSLDADDFLHGLLPDEQAANASEAASTLRSLNAALLTYSTTYPEIGLPATLQQLSGGAPGGQPSPQHAMLVNSTFAETPTISDGYEFHYTMIDPGSGDQDAEKGHEGYYRLTATPVEFGKTGSKSFFTDSSGIIRVTTEKREANENDDPI